MIKQLHPGDTQISAAGWNEMRAVVQGLTPGQQQYQSNQRSPVYITVKNVTATDLPAFSVVKLSVATYSFSSRSDYVDLAIKNGVELDGDTPTTAADPIAVIQADCPAGGFVKAIVSGATPVRVTIDTGSINSYSPCMYAKVAPNSYSLAVTYDITPIRIIGNIYNSYGYAIIDNNDDRQRFILYCTPSNNYASIAKKGAAFKISRGRNGWEVEYNNNASVKYIIAICQEDVPDGFTGYYNMPFYTPEQNYGAAPAVAANSGITTADSAVGHRGVGVASGGGRVGFEHEFSNKRLDYMYSHGQYTYCPKFTYTGAAVSYNNGVGIVIEGHTYAVTFPAIAPSYNSSMMAPDVYAGDIITVLVEESVSSNYSAAVTAIEYPTDFAKGSSIVVEGTMLLGRGWDEDYITGSDFKYAIKIQGAALI